MSDKPRSHGRLAVRPTLKPAELMKHTPDIAGVWKAKVITLFPEAFPGVLGASLTGKALQEGKWQLEPIDLRPFGLGKHRKVDDTPAGGGPGLVMRADVLGAALDHAQADAPTDRKIWPLLYMSPRGKPITQADAERFSKCEGVTILCGRFEGVDERVIEEYEIEEICVGDAVLTGGELPTQILIDATTRLLPDVIGNAESLAAESFQNGLLEHPQYTQPRTWRGRDIPEVLLSGDHGAVEKWRGQKAEEITQRRRPDIGKS
ncbi:MAG: tRNA (guanosine(37)-N1)-methyltransferase TrmD [Pseudomonadota bacterium]